MEWKDPNESSTYTWWLGDCMRADGLAARQDAKRQANCGKACVVVDVEEPDDGELPVGRFLREMRLLLEPREELYLVEDITSVIPEHRQSEPLVLGKCGAQVSIRTAVGLVRDRGGRIRVVDILGVVGIVRFPRPGFDGLLEAIRVEDRSNCLRARGRNGVLRGKNGGVCLDDG